MGVRMMSFAGIPLLGTLLAFVAFWYLSVEKNMAIQPNMVAYTTIFFLVIGLGGITYAIFSTSWDPDREGSMLGMEEVKRNLGNVQDGLERSRLNQITREKMAKMSEEEIEAALRDLERRERQG
mmetsp:Transcript_22096/g.50981  ORF Transcript_22096/g.50981 Transcript_22096/m.50981 type:complete len:124 (-) Transcript_22096:168-539(-)